jgi:hypothetical protein
MVNQFAGFVRSYKVKSEKIKMHVAAFLVAAAPFAEILNDGFIFSLSIMMKKNSFIFILMIFVLLDFHLPFCHANCVLEKNQFCLVKVEGRIGSSSTKKIIATSTTPRSL